MDTVHRWTRVHPRTMWSKQRIHFQDRQFSIRSNRPMASHTSKQVKLTTTHFLTQAAINNDLDRLGSPSSSIVVGKPPRTGTGAFEVRATPPGEQRSPNGTPAAGDAVAAGGAADCEAPAKKPVRGPRAHVRHRGEPLETIGGIKMCVNCRLLT